MSSNDGIDWLHREPWTHDWLSAIAYGSGQFVALSGSHGDILTSGDGVTWVERESAPGQAFGAIAYGNGQFVAVGNEGVIVTSADGINWAEHPSGAPASFSAVAYGNGLFVAVGDVCTPDGCDGTMVTSTDGVKWVEHRSKTQPSAGIAYGNGRFVARGRAYSPAGLSIIITSVDGVNWMAGPQSETRFSLNGITYGNGQFVTVGDSGTILTSGDDGVTWVRRDSGTTNQLKGIVYGNGQFAAFAQGLNGRGEVTESNAFTVVLTSADGVNWVQRWSEKLYIPKAIAYGNATFVVVVWRLIECNGSFCGTEGVVVTSLDGVNWVLKQQGDDSPRDGLVYGDGQFMAFGNTGLVTSADGVNWAKQQSASGVLSTARNWRMPLGYGNGRFVVRESFTRTNGLFETSGTFDGVNWLQHEWRPETLPWAIGYGNGQFLAVGSSDTAWPPAGHGTIQTSTDGLNWVQHRKIAPHQLRGVAFGNGRFVAVGDFGIILQSDPIINLSIIPDISTSLLSVSVEGPTDLNYAIQTSPDLISWRDVTKITNNVSGRVSLGRLPANSGNLFFRAQSR